MMSRVRGLLQATVRWGVVGTGGVSDYFIHDLHAASGCDVVAVASRDPARADAYAAAHDVPSGYDFDTLLRDASVDVIYIATPPASHFPLARAGLLAGKHVVVEKPFTMDPAHAHELTELSAQTGLFLTEAMWMKFNPIVRQARQLVLDGAIGDVRSVRASFGLPFPHGVGSRWRADLGGSSLLDQGIYGVTLSSMFLGMPSSSDIRGTVIDGVDVTHRLDLTHQGGRFAQLAGSMVEYADPSAAISGTEGWISLDAPFWASRSLTVHRGDIPTALMSPEAHRSDPDGFGYVPMIESIGAAIRNGDREQPEHPYADILAMVECLSALHANLIAQSSSPC